MSLTIQQEYELVKLDDVEPHPDNPRRGNIAAIVESIKANGFYGSLLVQRSTNYVLAGNHRWLAASRLHIDQIPVTWIDCDDITAKRILLADNRTSDMGIYDEASLFEALRDLPDLAGTGYTEEDFARLESATQALLDDLEARPVEFKAYDKEIQTDFECPKCHYTWSRKQ